MILQPTGLEYLSLVTDLLHRDRRSSFEAADFQWWWRKDQHRDAGRATFWMYDDKPVAAAVFTDWGRFVGLDVLGDAGPEVWEWALGHFPPGDLPVATSLWNGEPVPPGFEADGEVHAMLWRPPGDVPTSALPPSYTLVSRADHPVGDHWLAGRNGGEVEARLRETWLYRADCDLAVLAPDGSVAAYGVFWPDLVTGVGLVEPMRTEEAHGGRGLARHVLLEGCRRLAAAGCTELKVTPDPSNEVAMKLYTGAGFAQRGPLVPSYTLAR